MRSVRVLFFWEVPEILKNYLREGIDRDDIELIFPEKVKEELFLEIAPKIDILVGWRPSMDLLEKSTRAGLFINPGAGIRRLIEPFKKLNSQRSNPLILVNGHGNSYFTAQHAVALLLATLNKIVVHHNWMKEGLWRRGDNYAKSEPLRSKKIGLLGYGAVNQKVHNFLSGFDISFAALKRKWENQPTGLDIYEPDELHEFLRSIDLLLIAVPLTSQTEGMIGERELTLLGDKGIIINIARGGIIDEKALFKALNERKLAGAGIDVWYNYDPDPDTEDKKYPYSFPFHEIESVVLSPHRGASPMNDLLRWDEVIENIKRYANGRKDFVNVVDLDLEY